MKYNNDCREPPCIQQLLQHLPAANTQLPIIIASTNNNCFFNCQCGSCFVKMNFCEGSSIYLALACHSCQTTNDTKCRASFAQKSLARKNNATVRASVPYDVYNIEPFHINHKSPLYNNGRVVEEVISAHILRLSSAASYYTNYNIITYKPKNN